ncbi:uncharacterized protein [Phyllobates terribilis]|uniref:uncharacterized protein n=1 Tax=Phyllobates terribilis TaxID=111132 RepID=UPI003CCB4E05
MYYSYFCALIPCECPRPVSTTTTHPPTTNNILSTTTQHPTTTTMPSTPQGKDCWCLPQHCSPDMYNSYLCRLIPCECPPTTTIPANPTSVATKPPYTEFCFCPCTSYNLGYCLRPFYCAPCPFTTIKPTTTTIITKPTKPVKCLCTCLGHFKNYCVRPSSCSPCTRPGSTTTQYPPTTAMQLITTKRPTTSTMPSTTKGNDQCWCLPQLCTPEMYYSYLCLLIPCECPRPVSTTTHPPTTNTILSTTTQHPTSTTMPSTPKGKDCWCLPQHCSPDMYYSPLCRLIPCECPPTTTIPANPTSVATKPPYTEFCFCPCTAYNLGYCLRPFYCAPCPFTTIKPTTTTIITKPTKPVKCLCTCLGHFKNYCVRPSSCSPCTRPGNTTTQYPPTTAMQLSTTTSTMPSTTKGNDQCWCLPQLCTPEMYYSYLCLLIPCECPRPVSTTTHPPTTNTILSTTTQHPTSTTMPSTPKGKDCWCLPQHCSPDMYYSPLCRLIPCECPPTTTIPANPTSVTTKPPYTEFCFCPCTAYNLGYCLRPFYCAPCPFTTIKPTTTTIITKPTKPVKCLCTCLGHFKNYCVRPSSCSPCTRPGSTTTQYPPTTAMQLITTKRPTTSTMPSTTKGKDCWCLPQLCTPEMYYSYLCALMQCECPGPVSTTTHPPTTNNMLSTTTQPPTSTTMPSTPKGKDCWCLPQPCSPDMYYSPLCRLIPCECPPTTIKPTTTSITTKPTKPFPCLCTCLGQLLKYCARPSSCPPCTTLQPSTSSTTLFTRTNGLFMNSTTSTAKPTMPTVPWYGFLLIALAASIIVPALLCIYCLIIKYSKFHGVANFTEPSFTC